jgi:WD40 repeat protein
MGVVYQARQTKLGRVVALKMILSGAHAGEADVARFRTEAEAIARLQHPNIVQIHEVGEQDGLPYFSLEFCPGGSLDKKLAGTPLPPGEAAALVEALARAMQAAHKKGVIHRDLKPANVLFAEDGTPKVTDFGLAKKLDEAGQTQSGAVMGTPSYMAPEQAGYKPDAQTRGIGPAADVYALGAILYEMLTGRPPFRAATALDTLMQVVSDEPVPPTQLQSKVPRDLETICLKCLNKEPARRYESAAALADDLGRWQRGEAVLARPPSLPYLLGKQLRRHRVPMTAAAVVLLATVIGVVVSFLQISAALEREKDARGTAQTKEQAAQEALAKERKALADLKAQFSAVARGFCDRSDLEFRTGRVADSLNSMLRAYEVAPADDPLRQSYRHLLAAQGRSLARTFLHDSGVNAVAFSSDGRSVLTGCADGTAQLWDAATGRPLGGALRHEGPMHAMAFSPDGRRVLTGGADGTARLWDAATGKPIGEPIRHGRYVMAVAFSPDDRTVLTGSGDRTARLWDGVAGKLLAELHHEGVVYAVALSPDGNRILTGSADGTARLWDAATGKPIGEPFRHAADVLAVAFSPNGRRVFTGSADGTARLWDAATGKSLGKPLRHEGPVRAVAFSPDGRAVLTGSFANTARLWDPATGKQLGEPLRHEGSVRAVAFSPDGRTVLTGGDDNVARLWDRVAGMAFAEFRHEDIVDAVAFSPDGHAVLTGSWDKTARLWDAATGKPIGEPFRHAADVYAVAFSPDGRRILTGSADWTARLWDAATGKPLGSLGKPLGHEGGVRAVAFSSDGRALLTGGDGKVARLWDGATGKPLGEPLRHEGILNAVAFSPDGHAVLTGSEDRAARLWDATTGRPLGEPLRHGRAVLAVAFSSDGRMVLTGGEDRTARLWDSTAGKLRAEFRHEDRVHAVAFSPDGRIVLTGSDDKTARLWDAATGKQLGEALHHEGPVRAVAFRPDGRAVLTGSADKAARLWEVIAPGPDEPPRLRAWVAVRTGKAFDDRGILRQLTQAEWLQPWQELNANGGDWEPRPDGRRWHLLQADEAEAAEQWFAAAFHLNWLLKNDPDNANLRSRRDNAETHQKR